MKDDARADVGEATELSAGETHAIALEPGSRLVLDSEGLGWTNLYAALTSERRWSGTLQPIDHTCFAYCLRRSATIVRRIHGEDCATTAVLGPRQMGFLPTRLSSSWRLSGSADIMMVYLRGTLMKRLARELYGAEGPDFEIKPRIGVIDPLLEQLALEIVSALHRRDRAADPAYIDGLAAMAGVHLLRHHATPRRSEPAPIGRIASPGSLGASLYRVRDHIEDHLDRDLSLESLAREADLTPTAFSQAFSATYGETPHQYVIKRRVERSKRLLVGTDLPIAEVALQTGFSSQSHLSDVFKRATGETPRNYRRGAIRSVPGGDAAG